MTKKPRYYRGSRRIPFTKMEVAKNASPVFCPEKGSVLECLTKNNWCKFFQDWPVYSNIDGRYGRLPQCVDHTFNKLHKPKAGK